MSDKDPEMKKFNTEEAALYLEVSPETLKKWRKDKKGPDYYKVGGTIYYAFEDMNTWLKSCKVTH